MTTTSDTSVVRDLAFPQSPETVWNALTDPAALAEWLMPNEMKPEIGHKFEFRQQPVGGWDGIIQCEILECVPMSRLAYTWGSLGLATTVTFELEPDGTGTRVHFSQTGFDETQTQNKKGAEYGWTAFFQKLTDVLASK